MGFTGLEGGKSSLVHFGEFVRGFWCHLREVLFWEVYVGLVVGTLMKGGMARLMVKLGDCG